tara:strand:+ start:1370 stop:1558 length:189 start_codon:yes stop_codon:yes gene_type:complete
MANNGKGVTFTHAGKEMPVDAFLGWCSGVGAAGSFKKWQWTNVYVRFFFFVKFRLFCEKLIF